MTFAELKAAYDGLSRDQKKEIAEGAGFLGEDTIKEKVAEQLKPKEEQLKLVSSERETLKGEVEKLKKEKLEGEMKETIEAALSEGKILPANKEQWEKLFMADPEGVKAVLKVKAKEIDTGTKGKGDAGGKGADEGGDTEQMSEDEKYLHELWEHSEEDIKKFGTDKSIPQLHHLVQQNAARYSKNLQLAKQQLLAQGKLGGEA